MSACTCRPPHPRAKHRRGVGRCLVAGCTCVFGPPPPARHAPPVQVARGTATVDASGLVVEFKPPSKRTRLEDMLERRIRDDGLPLPVKQFLWARPERMYRSDFAYVQERILIEVQGGIWAQDPGRHNRGSGYETDCQRDNLAALLGWKLLRFTERMIKYGEACETIQRALKPRIEAAEQLPLTELRRHAAR